jgi:hypothetical protein
MSRRLVPITVLVPLVLLSLASMGATIAPTRLPPPLTVHEWGTFTSVAGADGHAFEWSPLDGPDDLPCFVERYAYLSKGSLSGTVRMETPVLYFYAPDETTVNVNVRFRKGAITEWYPRATVTPRSYRTGGELLAPTFTSTASWTNVRVTPGNVTPDLRSEKGSSHYYMARNTDAAPVHVSDQQEKFLFYRGVGNFQPPITAIVGTDGTLTVKSRMAEPLGDLVWFEHRGTKMGFQVQQIADGDVTLTPPVLAEGATPPTAELEQILIAKGLFPREAKAMVDTWRDSWFEEGARLLYIAPRSAIDEVLPLEITPAPREVTRAFVGRIELITATTRQEVTRALENRDTPTLMKYGRFVNAIAWQILRPMGRSEMDRLGGALTPVYQAHFDARRAHCSAPLQTSLLQPAPAPR